MKMVKSYTMTVTNQMDHLIINQQMKEYDLDFNKLASIEFEDALKVEYNPHYENKVECILNNMLIGLHYFDYINMIEPYKSKLVSLLKENNKEAYNHGKKFYTVVSNNGYNTKKQYRKSMEILLNEMKQEYKKVVNDKSIYSRFFDLVCIK
jgi:hypothetical protein